MDSTWIERVIPLERPEYAKQAEALLTDLIWRSKGSILAGDESNDSYLKALAKMPRKKEKRLPEMDRLIPRRIGGGNPGVVETFPVALDVPVSELISTANGLPTPIKALLESLLAPRSRGDRSLACVPIHPHAVVFQTLHGMVNKSDPPNMADIIEHVGLLGGSEGYGAVASRFLQLVLKPTPMAEGFTGLVDYLLPYLSKRVWQALPTLPTVEPPSPGEKPRSLPGWPSHITPGIVSPRPPLLLATHSATPFHWFWNKWKTLCDPSAGWYETLPTRRFIDWALCLLRIGLAFAYLWEANFFCRLYDFIEERANFPGTSVAFGALRFAVHNGSILATIQAPKVPSTQKDEGKALEILLARGYEFRRKVIQYLREDTRSFAEDTFASLDDCTRAWVEGLSTEEVRGLAEPFEIRDDSAKNTRYLVRYLLLPRSSDDDSVDQADFYCLARSNSTNFWFQPGPEWLVVVTSLLCKRPGERCTLGMLLNDLAALGIKVERSVLVSLLEETGLSIDSPDADNALVITSAF